MDSEPAIIGKTISLTETRGAFELKLKELKQYIGGVCDGGNEVFNGNNDEETKYISICEYSAWVCRLKTRTKTIKCGRLCRPIRLTADLLRTIIFTCPKISLDNYTSLNRRQIEIGKMFPVGWNRKKN